MTLSDSEAKLLKLEQENELLHKQIVCLKKQLDKIQNTNATIVTESIFSHSILSNHSHPHSQLAIVSHTSRSKSEHSLKTVKSVSKFNISSNINRVTIHKLKRKASTTDDITRTNNSFNHANIFVLYFLKF